MKAKPALNDPDVPVKIGSRPYEMAGRKEDRVPLVNFEDLTGWTVEPHDGAQAGLVRTHEQQLWGSYVAKLSYKGASPAGWIVLRPPAPIPIPEASDCINLWIYGNNWSWAADPKNPVTVVSVLIRDSKGNEKPIELTQVRWKEWWLAHKKLGASLAGASFTGIQVSEMTNTEENVLFFDSLCFYKEKLEPLKFDPRPARNLTLFPGQDPGLNTGPGKLPFPTREETILPANLAKGFKNYVQEGPKGTYTFQYAGPDATVEYIYTPKAGSLGEITAGVTGVKASVPMFGGGIEFADGKVPDGKLIEANLKDNVLRMTWDFGGAKVEYAFRIWQKSLVMDFICRGGAATGVSFGELHGVEKPRLVLIPFLTFGASPKVLCSGKPGSPLFTTVWADWYRSNGSELWTTDWVLSDTARINGGVHYIARTDGKRNDLYDRVFLTVSPTFEETLPTIPNPPSPLGKIAGERLWQESWGPENYAKEHARSKTLRSYGIDKLTQCNHEITWRDGGESFTMRTKSAPGKGGDEALSKYVAAQQSLGWLSGLYTNYTDFAPVNENWSEDKVQFTPEGEWRPAWPRCYALKPSSAVELDAKLAPIIQKKFGSNAAYTDVQTAVPPWMYCDYDARVPGAGTFAATFYAYGELLLNDQKTYGPSWSEGSYHFFYAGLATGNYGLAYSQPDMSQEPLNVTFDLMKIHPLECDIGMPWTGGFFKSGGDWQSADKIDQSIDHFIAATIAYGHIGWLVEEIHGIQRTCRSYYMLQQLQKRYAMRRPEKIEYVDDVGRWLTVSQAIATEAIKHSRLHVLYDNGLDIFVNGSRDTWTLPNGAMLPSWGWYARDKKGEFIEYSALIDGHRIDYVKSPDYEYLDGRGVPTIHNGLAAKGSIAVRRSGKSVEVIDIYGNDEIGVAVTGSVACKAFGVDGKDLGPVDLRQAQGGMVWLTALKDARRYLIQPERGAPKAVKLSINFPRDYVVAGENAVAEVCCAANREAAIQAAAISVEGAENNIAAWRGLKLQAGEMKCASVSVSLPSNLADGGRIRVKVSANIDGEKQPAQSWFALTVKPPFDISVRPVDQDRFAVDVRANLLASPEPDVTIQPDAGFTLTRSGSLYSILPPPGVKDATGKLTIKAQWKDFESVKEFPIKAIEEDPLVQNVIGEEGFAWGYAQRNKPERRIGEEGFSGKVGSIANVEELSCGGVFKRSIFMHPPWIDGTGYTFCETGPIELPDKNCEFRGFIGLKDGGAVSDGVVFTVFVIDETGVRHKIFEENWKERKWKQVSADLSAFRGKTIRLRFVADAGPKDNSTADWASWGEPLIVEKTPVMRVKIGD